MEGGDLERTVDNLLLEVELRLDLHSDDCPISARAGPVNTKIQDTGLRYHELSNMLWITLVRSC
jgi:hypothetical protein